MESASPFGKQLVGTTYAVTTTAVALPTSTLDVDAYSVKVLFALRPASCCILGICNRALPRCCALLCLLRKPVQQSAPPFRPRSTLTMVKNVKPVPQLSAFPVALFDRRFLRDPLRYFQIGSSCFIHPPLPRKSNALVPKTCEFTPVELVEPFS